jgi:hypothetical protein
MGSEHERAAAPWPATAESVDVFRPHRPAAWQDGGPDAERLAALGDTAERLAVRLRRDGEPPERMLVVVKDAARAATPPGVDPPAARHLMAHAVRRAIQSYFAA